MYLVLHFIDLSSIPLKGILATGSWDASVKVWQCNDINAYQVNLEHDLLSQLEHENQVRSGDKTSGLDLVGDCFLDLRIFFPMNFDFLKVSKMGGNKKMSYKKYPEKNSSNEAIAG